MNRCDQIKSALATGPLDGQAAKDWRTFLDLLAEACNQLQQADAERHVTKNVTRPTGEGSSRPPA